MIKNAKPANMIY